MTATTMATTNNKEKHLVIIGKRWFQKSYGNTYHSVKVLINGAEIVNVPFEYGYGDSYLDTAVRKLTDLGILPNDNRFGTAYLRDTFRTFTYTVTDVSRKKDL